MDYAELQHNYGQTPAELYMKLELREHNILLYQVNVPGTLHSFPIASTVLLGAVCEVLGAVCEVFGTASA